MDDVQLLQEKIDEFDKRIRELETRQLNQQQIRPNAITQSHILGGNIVFTGLAANRPTDGSTEQQAYFSTDTNTLSFWNGTSWIAYTPPVAPISLSSKTITFNRDTTAAGADVAYTGVGFTPTCILLFAVLGNVSWSTATFDSAKTAQAVFQVFGGVGNSNGGLILESSANNYQQAIVKTYDADGFTLTWSKTNSPTGTGNIVALCFK